MFSNWFNAKTPVIGVDIGRSAVKLAQVTVEAGVPRMGASAAIEVPEAQRETSAGPLEAFEEGVNDAIARDGFRGRRVILGLPATYVHIDRLRIATTLAGDELREAITWEAADKLPFHPTRAVLRHLVAGVVYHNDEQRQEVILMAVRKDVTTRLLGAAAKAKLDVVGIRPEPMALAEAFGREGGERQRAIVDIGHGATRMYVSRGARIEFARSIGIGWQHLRPQCVDAAGNAEASSATGASGDLLVAPAGARAALDREAMQRLTRELSLSLHYHAETFPASSVQELTFVGGASTHRQTCQQLAAGVGLPTRTADLIALAPDARVRPDLAVAISLSLAKPDGE